MKLIKFKRDDFIYPEYGIVRDETVSPIKNIFTISELFLAIRNNKIVSEGEIPINAIRPLPPTDENVHLFCAGLNYRDHADEVQMPIPRSPIFFTKPAGALCGARDAVIYPESVSLLDYEVELGIIIGTTIGKEDMITSENLHDYIIGIAIFNDVSARDIQMASGQWFLGKSFRTFAPLGPFIQVIEEGSATSIGNLNLELQVFSPDGKPYENKRQEGNTKNMIFNVETLINCLREKFDLRPGDVIATGTPRGVALAQPGRVRMRIAEILGIPQGKRIALFLEGEKKNNRKYLERGDTIRARIFSDDGKIDLGEQENRIT
jgi:2-keto-4-pentenoate hydratase/2-oxohepta-3-ene-1,7-dioic acid hydratase in catechol pathway